MRKVFLLFTTLFMLFLWQGKAADFTYSIKYTVKDGISDRTVNCLSQDNEGYLWIGTGRGLDRFDGHSFRHFDIGSGRGGSVFSILPLEEGKIWIGTGTGIVIFDTATGYYKPFEKETEWNVGVLCRVNILSRLSPEILFIGTGGQGFFLYNEMSGELRQFSQHASIIRSFVTSERGGFILGSEEGTVTEYEADGSFVRTLASESGNSEPRQAEVASITRKGNDLWCSMGYKGYCKISLEGSADQTFFKPGNQSSNLRVYCQLDDEGGHILVGTASGLYDFDSSNGGFSPITGTAAFAPPSGMGISCLFRDRESNLWIAVQGEGLLLYPYSAGGFSHILQGQNIAAISTDDNGKTWIGTSSGRLLRCERGLSNLSDCGISIPGIRCIMASYPEVWIGTSSDGIFIYNQLNGAVKNHRYDRYNLSTICDNCINAIFKDSRGKIYVGTAWGLCYFPPNSGTLDKVVFEPRSTNKSSICGFYEDSRGDIWILSENDGVYRENLKGGGWNHFFVQKNPNMSGNNVSCIAEDSKGRIWLGTSTGICTYSYEENAFTRMFFDLPSLRSKEILSIEKDSDGKLWAAGSDDLVCISPAVDSLCGIFEQGDGIKCKHFERSCSATTADGALLFGGIGGIELFAPSALKSSHISTVERKSVKISDIKADGISLGIHNNITLKPNVNTVEISFSDLDFRGRDSKRYLCHMDGVDDGWVFCGSAVAYSKLKPGRHRFVVKPAYTTEGDGDFLFASVEFKCKPPFYASPLAYVLYALVALLVALGLTRWMHRRNEKETFREKYNFFTNITHEIRTPLTLIKAPLESIIKSGDGNSQTKEWLQTINKSTDDLMDLVNQLLDYRKNEDGHYVLTKKECNIALMVTDLSCRFSSLAQSKGKNIEVDIPKESHNYEVGRDALTTIIQNLLSNAVKYAESRIKVSLKENEDNFILEIANDGTRVHSSEYDNIFKMFYQVKGSKSGTGIGLPLARMLARRHGGDITVRSDESLTRFIVTIPGERHDYVRAESNASSSDAEPTGDSAQAPEGASILLVDDNEDLRQMVSEMLRPLYTVYQASNGTEGIKVLENSDIDLILSDIIMPGMDGYEFCSFVKSDKRYSAIPFVHITAKTAVEDKIAALKTGADDYIEKPFSSELLLTKVKTAIENKRKVMDFYQGLPIVHPTKVAKITKTNADFLEKLKSELEKHLSDKDYNMASMAESMFMSQSTFYRKVKSLTGISPNDFVKDFRLQRAAQMMSKGEYTAYDVYDKVGFSSVSYFSLCFKKKYGMSPTKYLESIKSTS